MTTYQKGWLFAAILALIASIVWFVEGKVAFGIVFAAMAALAFARSTGWGQKRETDA